MYEEMEPEDQITTEALLCDLRSIRERSCSGCAKVICGHEALMSLVMGFKDAPLCWPCLSEALGHGRENLRDHLFSTITRRACYNEGWMWASREEGFQTNTFPVCLWPETNRVNAQPASLSYSPAVSQNMPHDAEWDAGDMGCGDLVLELRLRLQAFKPGAVIKVIATNSGAIEDLPAWCRMTGNALLYSDHPVYVIRRKDSR